MTSRVALLIAFGLFLKFILVIFNCTPQLRNGKLLAEKHMSGMQPVKKSAAKDDLKFYSQFAPRKEFLDPLQDKSNC